MALNKNIDKISIRSIIQDFIYENVRDEPSKLRVLDFDDTLAETEEQVRVTTDYGAGSKMISSQEFAIYDLQPGESIDPDIAFEEFSTVDVEKAAPMPFISDLFKRFVDAQGSRKILILTARDQGVEPFVMNFLERRLGIIDPASKVDFRGVGDKDPMRKVDVIDEYLESHPSINFVSFYDDSGKNVKAVSEYLSSRGLRSDVRQVVKDEEGNVSLVSPEDGDLEVDINERIDERAVTREFLRGLICE
jgi:hypothetical protein